MLSDLAKTQLVLPISTASGDPVESYAYRSEYDFYYKGLAPSRRKMDEWMVKTRDHAILEIANQIKRDRNDLAEAVGMAPVSPSP